MEENKVSKEDFIEYLSHTTPEELNELIDKKGKPRKPYYPFYVFRSKEETKNEQAREERD